MKRYDVLKITTFTHPV